MEKYNYTTVGELKSKGIEIKGWRVHDDFLAVYLSSGNIAVDFPYDYGIYFPDGKKFWPDDSTMDLWLKDLEETEHAFSMMEA